MAATTLVGLKRPHPGLFEDIAWSTPEVLACTLRRAEEIGLPVTLLPTSCDVDEPEDFRRLQAEFFAQAQGIGAAVASGPARRTRAFLAAWTETQEFAR